MSANCFCWALKTSPSICRSAIDKGHALHTCGMARICQGLHGEARQRPEQGYIGVQKAIARGSTEAPGVLWRSGQPSTESGVSTSLNVQEEPKKLSDEQESSEGGQAICQRIQAAGDWADPALHVHPFAMPPAKAQSCRKSARKQESVPDSSFTG